MDATETASGHGGLQSGGGDLKAPATSAVEGGSDGRLGEGKRDGAHSASGEGLSELGEGLTVANQASGITNTEVEEDIRDGDAVLPRFLGSAWTKRATMRSSRTQRGSQEVVVAAMVFIGGGGAVR